MQREHSSGFTLIELMVTLTILVILGFIAVPSFRSMIEKGRLRSDADNVVNLLGVARGEAIKRQHNVTVAFGGTSAAWCVGANRAPDPTAPSATVSAQPTPPAVACDCSTAATSCILENQTSVVTPAANGGVTGGPVSGSRFAYAQGGITFSAQTGTLIPLATIPGLVTLTSPSGYALQITVSPLGQVGACVPAGISFISGYPSC